MGSVNVVVETVEKASSDHSGKALGSDLDVGRFVDLTGTHWVVAECAHSPAHWSSSIAKFGVEFGIGFGNEFLVGLRDVVVYLGDDAVFTKVLLVWRVDWCNVADFSLLGISSAQGPESVLVFLLDDVVVGDIGLVTCLDGGAPEKKRSLEDIIPLDCAVLLEDDCVDIWNKKQGGQDGAGRSGSDGNSSDLDDVSRWFGSGC